MIKNWTTTFKSVKRNKYKNYIAYLQNDNHSNHKENHKIVDFELDTNRILVNNLKLLENQMYKNLLKNKGGRPLTSMGVSVVLSLPERFENKKKLQIFINNFLKSYYIDICKMEKLNSTSKGFQNWKKNIFYNVHLKDSGSKTQFNFTFPNFIASEILDQEKGFLKDKITHIEQKKIDMTQKKFSYLFKNIANKQVLKKFGLDVRTYEKKSEKTMKYKQSQNYYKTNKKVQELENKKNILQNEVIKLEEQKSKAIQYITKSNVKMKNFEKNMIKDKTLRTYLNRLEKALNEGDTVKINKGVEKLKNRNCKVNQFNVDDLS